MLAVKIWILIILIIICIVDIKQMIIPDICILLILPAALFSEGPWRSRISAAAVVWAAFLLLAVISALLKGPTPIGMGDIKLFSAIALISGPSGLAASAVMSSLLGGTFAAVLLTFKKAQKKDQIAFGPFIAIGYAAYLASTSAI